MDEEQPTYFSYLVRVWQEHDDGMLHQLGDASHYTENRTIWLASVESSLTGKRQGFANLDDLFAFLRRQAGTVSDPESEETRTKGR